MTVETRRWCTRYTITNARPSAVGNGAVGLRAEWAGGTEASAGGGALGRRGGERVEEENTAAALTASRWIVRPRLYIRTRVTVTQAHCRRLASSLRTKLMPPSHRSTQLACDVRGRNSNTAATIILCCNANETRVGIAVAGATFTVVIICGGAVGGRAWVTWPWIAGAAGEDAVET